MPSGVFDLPNTHAGLVAAANHGTPHSEIEIRTRETAAA